MSLIRGLLVALCVVFLSGCVYTNIAIPLDTDLDKTQLGNKVGNSQYQSVFWLFAWGDAGTQAAARDGGITSLNQADTEILSVLMGLYYQQTTVVYGD